MTLKKYAAPLALLAGLLFQVICAVQSFDLTDEGFLMNGYRWMGEDPTACRDMAGYALTGYLGWLLHSLYPAGGILMMRLWGILLVTLTGAIVYRLLKNEVPRTPLLVGILLQTIFVAGDPKPFGYNTLTALLLITAFFSILRGLRHKQMAWLALGGTLAGFSVFLRLPNLLFASLAVLPFFWHWSLRKRAWTEALSIAVSFAIGLGASWLLLCSIGANVLITDYLSYAGETMNGTSTHNMGTMLHRYMGNYKEALYQLSVFVLAISIAAQGFRCRQTALRWLTGLFGGWMIYYTSYINTSILGLSIIALFNAIGIAGCLCYMWRSQSFRFVPFAAIMFSLIIPLGSDGGFETIWVGTWLSLPIGLCGLVEFGRQCGSLSLRTDIKPSLLAVPHLHTAAMIGCFALIPPTIVKIYHKCYYDPGDRYKKVYAINSPAAQGILAEKSRADIINPLLEELQQHVSPGDTLFVYDFSPMLCYLTDTKPYVGAAWPCVLNDAHWDSLLKQEEEKGQHLPVAVVQHFYSCNKWSDRRAMYLTKYDNFNPSHTAIAVDFLRRNHYKTVWTNGYYEIMKPNR